MPGGRKPQHARCRAVQREISRRDGRFALQWRLRAHTRSCPHCKTFCAQIDERSDDFGVLAPPMSATAAAAVFESLGLGGPGPRGP